MHLDELINRFYDSMYYRKEINEETHKFLIDLLWSPERLRADIQGCIECAPESG